jgi:STE24 endopeptidase
MSLVVLNTGLYKPHGAQEISFPVNLLAITLIKTPFNKILFISLNRNEYQADAFAATSFRSGPLQDALKKLSVNNLGNLTPHPAFVFFNYSHPPLMERLKALEKYA